MTVRHRVLAVAAGAVACLAALPGLASAGLRTSDDQGAVRTGGMTHLANIPYTGGGGSDVEFLTTGGRDYAIAGSLRGGMKIIDITTPSQPSLVATYDCPVNQGDVQVFRSGARILATYAADSTLGATRTGSACAQQLNLPATFTGAVIVDLTDPTAPRGLSAIPISTGSHNLTVHPSGRYLYNSNSDLATDTTPQIEIFDISDPTAPVKIRDFFFPFQPGLGSNSHDVDFSDDGTRGYSAALSSTLVLDTTDPGDPKLIAQVVNPRINVEHDVKWVPMRRPDGTTRELLLVGDEQGGAAATAGCPGGGVTVYDVTGALERNPVDLGTWYIPDTGPAGQPTDGTGVAGATTCTSHVFQVYPEQGLLTIAWYQAGVRVLDISGLATYQRPAGEPTVSVNGSGVGMKQIGSYFFPNSDTWSFKTNRINADGSFVGYGNDISRGFDAYAFPGFADGRTVPVFGPDQPGADIPEVPVAVLLPLAALLVGGAAVVTRRRVASRA